MPTQVPSSPPKTRHAVTRRDTRDASVVRPYPRASMAAARSTERSSAPSSTGMASLLRFPSPLPPCPRSRWAARTRLASVTSWGANVSAITQATPISYNAPGTERTSRREMPRALAAPMQHRIVASCRASYVARSSASRLITPPSLSPLASGIGRDGSVTRTVEPWSPVDNRAWKRIRTTMTTSDTLRNATYERAHDAVLLRAATTNPVTTRISTSGTGFCVRLAAAASAMAHSHQAPGCRVRGKLGRFCGRIADSGHPVAPGQRQGAAADDHHGGHHADECPRDPAVSVLRLGGGAVAGLRGGRNRERDVALGGRRRRVLDGDRAT